MTLNGSRANEIHGDGTEVFYGSYERSFACAFVMPTREWALVKTYWVDVPGDRGGYRNEYHFLPETWVLV